MEWIKEIEPVVKLLNGMVSPLIAVTVVYIAYQQWKTNQRKEDREIRSIKISIYKRVKTLLSHIDSTREVKTDHYDEFKQAAAEADFVFSESIREYLNNIDSQAGQWLDYKECLDSAAADADKASLCKIEDENEKIIDFLQDAHCELYEMFADQILDKKNA